MASGSRSAASTGRTTARLDTHEPLTEQHHTPWRRLSPQLGCLRWNGTGRMAWARRPTSPCYPARASAPHRREWCSEPRQLWRVSRPTAVAQPATINTTPIAIATRFPVIRPATVHRANAHQNDRHRGSDSTARHDSDIPHAPSPPTRTNRGSGSPTQPLLWCLHPGQAPPTPSLSSVIAPSMQRNPVRIETTGRALLPPARSLRPTRHPRGLR